MASTTGTIKRKTDKGFGFIAAADGTEYFFHQSGCVATSFDELREGQRSSTRSLVTCPQPGLSGLELFDGPSSVVLRFGCCHMSS